MSATGATVHVVRFAKLLATLNLERYAWWQEKDGTMVLAYRSPTPMDATVQSIVRTAVCGALGPTTEIRIERLAGEIAASGPRAVPLEGAPVAWRKNEPSGPQLNEVAEWLRHVLRRVKHIALF